MANFRACGLYLNTKKKIRKKDVGTHQSTDHFVRLSIQTEQLKKFFLKNNQGKLNMDSVLDDIRDYLFGNVNNSNVIIFLKI